MNRYALLTDANTFPLLGAGAALRGCVNDNRNFISRIMQGPWKKSGYTKAYLLSERLNDADIVRERLAELIDLAKEGDTLVLTVSEHGTHFLDWITGKKCSSTVAHHSDWNKPRTFVSKLDYQRAFEKLKPGVNVWCFFDTCESGNMGQAFRLLEQPDRDNRWLEPPLEYAKTLDEMELDKSRAIPSQCCTMAGCTEQGTCADVGGPSPHGLFSATRDKHLLATRAGFDKPLGWFELAQYINHEWTLNGEEQRCVVDGPDRAFDLA